MHPSNTWGTIGYINDDLTLFLTLRQKKMMKTELDLIDKKKINVYQKYQKLSDESKKEVKSLMKKKIK
jgi:hypothetical protein